MAFLQLDFVRSSCSRSKVEIGLGLGLGLGHECLKTSVRKHFGPIIYVKNL
ncbi:MAG: hypothetical protein HW387_1181 [Parachlamydiales bacterium]|nr:hypothetical protein [Parachlamydiales bacterium]